MILVDPVHVGTNAISRIVVISITTPIRFLSTSTPMPSRILKPVTKCLAMPPYEQNVTRGHNQHSCDGIFPEACEFIYCRLVIVV